MLVLLLFINYSFANYTETRVYRNCNNFEYPIDISFSGRLSKIPELGHSYEATYDSKHNYRLISVKHYFNGKHLPIYNYSPSDYYNGIIGYPLVATVVFNYDERNRISNIDLKNLKNEFCLNKWGTAQYSYEYESPSSFDCFEFRYYIDYTDNKILKKKPLSLQILNQFHLEHQLAENKFWQRKTWFVGVNNYLSEYQSFHSNGEPKSVRLLKCNKMNYKLDIGASGYLEYIYNDFAWPIELNTYSSDSKLYGRFAKTKTEVIKNKDNYTFKTLSYSADNRFNGKNYNNQQEETDQTFLPLKTVYIDSSGFEAFLYDDWSNGTIYKREFNSLNCYTITDSLINFKGAIKQAAIESRVHNSEGFLMEVHRKDSRNSDYIDQYVPYKELYTYYWNTEGLPKIDSVVQKNWFKKAGKNKSDSIEIIRTTYNQLGFFREKETRIEDLDTQRSYVNYEQNSLKTEEYNTYYNSSNKYSLVEGQFNYTEIDSSFNYGELNEIIQVTYSKIGKNFLPTEEIKLRKDYDSEKLVGSYNANEFSLYKEQKDIIKLKRDFNENGRLNKLQYYFGNGDSLEIYYKYKDIPLDYFYLENNYHRKSEMELRRNNMPASDEKGIHKYFFNYDNNGNLSMKYGMKEDGSFEQAGGYNDLDILFVNNMPDNLFDNLIIPKYEYNRSGMVAKVTFWKNDLKSKGYDNRGIHEYTFMYDKNYNPFSIIAKDEISGERKDDIYGTCEKCFFTDEYGNLTHSYTKNKNGEILENEITIKEFSGYDYGNEKLVSETYYTVEQNRLVKTMKDGYHQTKLKVYSNPDGKKIQIKSYFDKEGKLIKKNGASQIRIETNIYDWQNDTLSKAYYNDLGYVSEDSLFYNLADSVFFEGKGWVKESMMKMTKETFPNISTGYKKETVYYNSKGKETNNEYGFARSIICDSLPFYIYEMYYSENGKLAFNGDPGKEYFVTITSPKEFETQKLFFNDKGQNVKNEMGCPMVKTKTYWIKGVRVIENSFFDFKGKKKVADKNGVHKVIYYLNNSFYDLVADTLASISFDKKNKVVSNELGSFVSIFGERFYNSLDFELAKFSLDSLAIIEKDPSLLLDSIELNKSFSRFKFIYAGNNIYINKNLKLIQEGTNSEYKLIKSVGVPMSKDNSPNNETAREMDNNGNISFYLYFEPLPKKKANYKFIENLYSESAWNSIGFTISIPDK